MLKNDYAALFAENIRAQRARKQLGQMEVAAAMGAHGFHWAPQTVSKIERCGRAITAAEMCALAGILDVPLSALLTATAQ